MGRALVRDGRLAAWADPPCRTGHKIGPLVADDRAAAEAVFAALLAAAAAAKPFRSSLSRRPERQRRDAVALAQAHGLAPVFETARMYAGPIRPLRIERVFGVTTFELG